LGRPELAIIIPAHNEERTIGRVVSAAKQFGAVIVADDASTDNTANVARVAGATVLTHRTNKGYDGALNTGFAGASEAGAEYAITIDADGQHPIDRIPAFVQELKRSAAVVCGIRPRPARFAEWLFGKITNALYGIRDPLCGMKGYRLGVYRERGHFDSYQSIGTELALFAARRGYPIAQVEIPVAERIDSPRFGQRYRANARILKALWRGVCYR
jgi:glycosyltransferase involved in cell wall biosynthesis